MNRLPQAGTSEHVTGTWFSMLSDAASLAHELFVPEVFAQDNLPEHLTRSELHRSISHLGDLERLQCFLDKVCAWCWVRVRVRFLDKASACVGTGSHNHRVPQPCRTCVPEVQGRSSSEHHCTCAVPCTHRSTTAAYTPWHHHSCVRAATSPSASWGDP